jgi:hypothetical protein
MQDRCIGQKYAVQIRSRRQASVVNSRYDVSLERRIAKRQNASQLATAPIVAVLLALISAARAAGHEMADHLPRGFQYYALIDDFHANPSTTNSTGEIFLSLNSARTQLSYVIVLDDLLRLKPNPADRTEPDDILGIHLHLHVPDAFGPHILNIFGLATYGTPAEEDGDLIVDYEHRTLTGKYDISDATIDPATGEPYFQFFPLTTKVIYDWLDELDRGELMVAVHTVETGFPTMAIHGHISRIVPEPTTGVLLISGVTWFWLSARKCRPARRHARFEQ